MSLYDTLQKTKQELPYRFQRLQNEANAKRAETVTPNTNQVSREQGIRDSYRKRVEQEQQAKDNLEKAIQMTVGGYNISPGSSLIQKAVQNTIGQDISRDYFKQAVGDETTIGGVLQKQIDILGDQISKRQNELNERLAEETVSGEPILDPLRNQITSMSQQWRDTKDKLKMLNQLESAMNSSYEQQELLSPDEYKSQVQDLQKQIDTLMEQERVWQDAQYSNALGMEYLGGNVPAQSVQSEIDKLVAQRDKLNALIPEAESVQWENKMKDEILAAGGEDLLRQIMELSRQKQEQEYDNSNYTDYKNAVDALKAQGYDQKTLNDWFAYAERIRNREEYQKSMEWAQSFAQEHPVASSIVSVPINLVSGVGALDVLGQNITKNFTGRPVDYRTPAMQFSGEANTIRGQVASDIENATDDWALSDTKFGNAYSTGYQLLMSMADSLGAAGLSAVGVPFSGALLGGSAATNAITEARGRGASDGQAIVYGLMAGVAETLFESLSIESLVKLDDPSTVRAAILNILKQGGVEASEELNTSIANTMSDLLVMGPKSQLLTDKRNYLDNGFSQKEASRLAMSNWFNGLMGDALGGFLSGGMMSAFSRPIQSLGQYRNQNNNALDAAIQETMKPTQELDNLNNNWNIKKDAALGGEKLGTNAASPDTSSAASDNNSIRGNSENVNGKSNMEQAVDALFPGMEGDVGDMGAKTSDFEHKVKESQTAQNTIGKNEARWNVPEDQRVNQQYDAVTEQESLNNARMRIEQDLPGEQEALRRAAVWSNEEVDMGMLILGGLRQKAKETGDWTAYKDWAEVVKQHGVASGQGLQAWAKYTRRTGDGIMQTVADILKNSKNGTDVNDVLETASHYADRFDGAVAEKSVSDLVSIIQDTAVTRKTKRSWGKKLGGEIDWALNRIADYADAEVRAAMNQEGDGSLQNYEFLRDFAAASIEDIAGDHVKSSVGKMALTVRRMAMLSKASTIMRNLVGNEAFDLVDTLARNISVPLDMLLSKMTGTRSVAFDSGALSKTGMKGQLDGLAKALLEVGLDVNAGGASSKYENSANRTFKMSGNVVSKLFSTWEKYMGYALNVTDEMKKGSVEARVQQGLDKLYEQGKIKDDSLRTGGQQEALYRTFQDKTRLSDMSLKGRNALNVWNVGDAGLGDVLVPFAQVPANLADRAIDYSPAGLVESTVNLSKVLLKAKKGTLTAAEQAQAVQNIGRNITGSALIVIAAGLAANGFIRVVNPGGEDENKDKAAFEKMQGQSGTQFNVSAFLRSQNGGSADWQDGDTLVSIAFLEPFNAHLTIGALLAEDMKEEGQLTVKTIAKDTFTGSLTAILDLPMFEKFRDVSDAYTYSTKERSGEKLLDAVNTLAANEVGSLIPNSVKGIAQGLDPYQRDLYSRDDAWGQAADQFRAVFDRDSLPIKQDSFGRDMMNEGGFLNFLNSNILPGHITTYKTDELLDKITDLSALTGKASVYPSRKAPDKITVDGEDVLLNQEQQRQYQSTYGQTEYETRSALIGNSLYDNLTPQEEIKAHSYAEDYAKQVAKSDINADFEPDSWVEELKGKTPAEVADAIMLKTFKSLAEDEKNYDSKYDGITSMLDSGTIDEAMAVSLLPKEANDGYYKHIKGSGIEISTFIDVYQFKTDARSDYDKDGKKVKSAQEKVIEYINKVGKGPGQKRRMFLAMYDSEKNLPEEWK